MAARHKLYYRIVQGSMSSEKIKNELRSQGLKVADVKLYKGGVTGVLTFQKKEDRETAQAAGSVEFDGVRLEFTGTVPPGGAAPKQKKPSSQQKTADPSKSSHGGAPQMATKFFNPYHFVNVEGFTPRSAPVPHDRFTGHCGRIEAEVEFLAPVFIPDPNRTSYIISDEALAKENEDEITEGCIHPTISGWLSQKGMTGNDLPLDIFFDPNCLGWDPNDPQNHLWLKNGVDIPGTRAQTGRIVKKGGRYCIEAREPNRLAHKVMEFFKINGQFALPPTSFKGMLRSTVETLSNSCFAGVEREDRAEYLFHRLDVQADNPELRGLKPVLLRKREDGTWGYVMIDQARVLSQHLFNRIGASGENALGAYLNQEDLTDEYYEKISVTGKHASRINDCSGLNAYHKQKKERGIIDSISKPSEIKTNAFAITRIKVQALTHARNQYNKTFPYVDSVVNIPQLWAIVRQREIPTPRGGSFLSYKVKVICGRREDLKNGFEIFVEQAMSEEPEPSRVKYAICEIRIKTAFDIDTKTQHRVFFLFGKEEFDKAVEQSHVQGFGRDEKTIIAQFRSLQRQRKEHAKKLPGKINRALAEDMPDDISDGMLAYYHPGEKYLTYTTVPQKPYKSGPRDILESMDKLPCDRLDRLCPACGMFGTVLPKKSRANGAGRKASGCRGKVTASAGTLLHSPEEPQPIILKPLSTPKPTFSPFYLLNNRKTKGHTGRSLSYDNQDLKVGRKIYLHHPEERLNYATESRTNLNVTVHPLPASTKFKFEIDFENLMNYELGLLLYAMDMNYKGEKPGYHLGMGKSLGLGSCRVDIKQVRLMDVKKRYSDLTESGWRDSLKKEERACLKALYQYVQGTKERKIYFQRLNEVNALDFIEAKDFPPEDAIEKNYFSLPYIRDFHILRSLNLHPEMKTDLPVHFAGGVENEGFKWYQDARPNRLQRLFEPVDLETDIFEGQNLETHALAP